VATNPSGLDTKLFSRLENIFSGFGYIFSRLDYIFWVSGFFRLAEAV
jgi:hypothetical protein